MANIVHDKSSASSSANAFIRQTWNQHQLYGLQSQLQLLNIPPNNSNLLLKFQTLIPQIGSMCGQSQTFFRDASKNHTNSSAKFIICLRLMYVGDNTHKNSTTDSNQFPGIAKPSNKWNTSEKHLANTNLPNEVKEAILNSIGTKWKHWKYKVKQMYLKNADNLEKLQQVPDERIEPQKWRLLISYWSLEEVQAQLKNSLSQIPERDQTEAFKNKVWLDNRGVDTRGRMRRVGKHMPTDQGHMSKNDRMSIIQGIRAELSKKYERKYCNKSNERQHKNYQKG
ncbi:hypothetical protein ACH5RR_000490 [Cinchona calisaya]|uniref:Uncharacterized protein n=1 Tax=Cinchona calisaya TaxID=153742 RepID=A0ABD3B1U8_9GENT